MRQIEIELDSSRCKGCELCVQACPRAVLAMDLKVNGLGYRPAALVDPGRCTGCKACALVCPEVAFRIWQVA